MADSDNTLKLLIQLGIIGQADAQAAKDLLVETKQAADGLSASMPESWQKQENFNKAIGGGSKAAAEFTDHSEGMRKVIGELNRVVPGLGEAFKAVETTMEGGNATLILVALAIQATMTYWDLYKEKVAAAAEAHAKALDHIRDVTKEARVEQEDFTKAMAEASVSQDKYADALGRATAVLDAQLKAKRALNQADEAAELAAAATPEEKAAIKKKYGEKETALGSEEEKGKLDLLNNVIASLKTDRDQALAEKAKLEEDKSKPENVRDPEKMSKIVSRLLELNSRITGDQTKITSYTNQADTAANVHAINDDSRTATSNRTVSKGVEGIDAAAHGQKLTQEQVKANAALTQLFSQQSGGIAAMQSIIKYHLQHSTTQAQETEALKKALATLQGQMRNMGGNSK